MEIIFVAWFFGGLIMGIVCCHFAYKGTEDDCNNKRQSDIDNDMRIYVPSRGRGRRGDNGLDTSDEIDNETLAAYLRTMAVTGISRMETEYLKEAAERLENVNTGNV